MPYCLRLAVALWCAILAAPLWAQTTDETPAEPQVGQQYVGAVHGDWSLRCLKTETGDDPCQMYQLLQDAQGNSVAEIVLRKLPEGGRAVAGATLLTPLETLLTEQVRVQIDSGATKQYPFSVCRPAGCVARLGITAEELAEYKAGSVARVTIVAFAAPDAPVQLDMSLSGFTAAFDAMG